MSDENKRKVVHTVLAVVAFMVVMGVVGELAQTATKHTPKHTSSLVQRVQPCNPKICLAR